jgi:RNA exonuclease 1
MFSSSRLFGSVPCPNGPDKCTLPNCIFSHAPKIKAVTVKPAPQSIINGTVIWKSSDAENGAGDQKRRKLDNGTDFVSVPQFGAPITGLSPLKKQSPSPGKLTHDIAKPENVVPNEPITVRRPISPPALGSQGKNAKRTPAAAGTKKAQSGEAELAPRAMPKDPAPYMTRFKLLKVLHQDMSRLNDEAAKSSDKSINALHLSKNELVVAALDVEEEIAHGKSTVYEMQVKHKIAYFRKMKLAEWKTYRLDAIQRAEELAHPKVDKTKDSKIPTSIETELSMLEQLSMLNRYVLKPEDCQNAGYILQAPTEAKIEDANKAVQSSLNYEVCERCGTRFQVFPERREDGGAFTTNGKCYHHWGKLRREERKKTDFATGTERSSVYICCNQPQGTLGCTAGDTHVYKIHGPNRLASVLQFVHTPVNQNAKKDLAVAFDCEMAWTTYGLELIRLSATFWPQGDALIDVLVKPYGEILDLNTRFSGITAEQYANAMPYDPGNKGDIPPPISSSTQPTTLHIVPSPAAARALLLSNITTTTPLIGHALDNDLNVLRLIHPTVVDTSLLFSHPAGLPIRYGLKNLVNKFLNREIQTAGDAGHDSLEDSRATGDLVRWKISRDWIWLKQEGWMAKDGLFFHKKEPANAVSLPEYAKSQSALQKNLKRKSETATPMFAIS